MPCESFAVCVVGISGADFLVFTLGVGWLVGWCDVVWCGVVGLEIRGLERRGEGGREEGKEISRELCLFKEGDVC